LCGHASNGLYPRVHALLLLHASDIITPQESSLPFPRHRRRRVTLWALSGRHGVRQNLSDLLHDTPAGGDFSDAVWIEHGTMLFAASVGKLNCVADRLLQLRNHGVSQVRPFFLVADVRLLPLVGRFQVVLRASQTPPEMPNQADKVASPARTRSKTRHQIPCWLWAGKVSSFWNSLSAVHVLNQTVICHPQTSKNTEPDNYGCTRAEYRRVNLGRPGTQYSG
jgi:hypothetical protein